MNKAVEYMGYVVYLTQEILLDSATPGKLAAERLNTNARMLHDTVLSWAKYLNFSHEDLLTHVWRHDPDAEQRYRERHKKATGKRARN